MVMFHSESCSLQQEPMASTISQVWILWEMSERVNSGQVCFQVYICVIGTRISETPAFLKIYFYWSTVSFRDTCILACVPQLVNYWMYQLIQQRYMESLLPARHHAKSWRNKDGKDIGLQVAPKLAHVQQLVICSTWTSVASMVHREGVGLTAPCPSAVLS